MVGLVLLLLPLLLLFVSLPLFPFLSFFGSALSLKPHSSVQATFPCFIFIRQHGHKRESFRKNKSVCFIQHEWIWEAEDGRISFTLSMGHWNWSKKLFSHNNILKSLCATIQDKCIKKDFCSAAVWPSRTLYDYYPRWDTARVQTLQNSEQACRWNAINTWHVVFGG